jgi:hypothetical protein
MHFVRSQSIVNKAFKFFALPWTLLGLCRAEQAIGLLGDEPGYADHVFIANGTHFQDRAIGKRADDGHQRIQRKVNGGNRFVARNEGLFEPQSHRLQHKEELLPRRGRQCPQQPILVQKWPGMGDRHRRLLYDRRNGAARRRVLDHPMRLAVRAARLGPVPKHHGRAVAPCCRVDSPVIRSQTRR